MVVVGQQNLWCHVVTTGLFLWQMSQSSTCMYEHYLILFTMHVESRIPFPSHPWWLLAIYTFPWYVLLTPMCPEVGSLWQVVTILAFHHSLQWFKPVFRCYDHDYWHYTNLFAISLPVHQISISHRKFFGFPLNASLLILCSLRWTHLTYS